ncbi:ABC transporter ATP-binding protein, partial [Treponema sp. C6A8]|uniref:ABC transporter ATP-binding protein n=1 Tax=Treponema sp. C6A8 TaxID=1410609 RepID=UPI00056F34FD
MIRVCDFSKAYKSSFQISGINFSVEPGKITALVGANGSGKTTLIKAICGFHYADSGKILLSREDASSEVDITQKTEMAMSLTGYVPEVSNLPPELKVYDFLKYAAKTHGLSDEAVEKALEDVIKKCNLGEVSSKKIKTLSKGFRQRVSLAQALIFNPPNLILDEPITGLDPLQIVELRKDLKELSKTKSILISTHILQEVEELCDNVVVIKNGKQIAFGSEKEILEKNGAKSLEELI